MLERTPYTVVGVLERTLTAPDRFAIVSIEDARELWVAKDPMLLNFTLGRGDLNTGAAVGWTLSEDGDTVARRIAATVSGVNVTIPSEISRVLRFRHQYNEHLPNSWGDNRINCRFHLPAVCLCDARLGLVG